MLLVFYNTTYKNELYSLLTLLQSHSVNCLQNLPVCQTELIMKQNLLFVLLSRIVLVFTKCTEVQLASYSSYMCCNPHVTCLLHVHYTYVCATLYVGFANFAVRQPRSYSVEYVCGCTHLQVYWTEQCNYVMLKVFFKVLQIPCKVFLARPLILKVVTLNTSRPLSTMSS